MQNQRSNERAAVRRKLQQWLAQIPNERLLLR
jgi:hypothetical protein